MILTMTMMATLKPSLTTIVPKSPPCITPNETNNMQTQKSITDSCNLSALMTIQMTMTTMMAKLKSLSMMMTATPLMMTNHYLANIDTCETNRPALPACAPPSYHSWCTHNQIPISNWHPMPWPPPQAPWCHTPLWHLLPCDHSSTTPTTPHFPTNTLWPMAQWCIMPPRAQHHWVWFPKPLTPTPTSTSTFHENPDLPTLHGCISSLCWTALSATIIDVTCPQFHNAPIAYPTSMNHWHHSTFQYPEWLLSPQITLFMFIFPVWVFSLPTWKVKVDSTINWHFLVV